MTTGISLIRENSESMQPPRALWVSFPLGRPLGKPGDANFQHEVIGAALDLLSRDSGPVLEDFPRDVPVTNASEAAPACPVSFAKADSSDGTWEARLAKDLAGVLPWYDLSRRRRNRSLVGVSTESPEANIQMIGRLLDEETLPLDRLKWFKHAVEDLKVLYLEALTAQPGEYDHAEIQRIFWRESHLGAALIQFYHLFRATNNPRIASIARIIVPRDVVGEGTGSEYSTSTQTQENR